MAASTNATTVLYGTPWDSRTLLEQQKRINLDLERRDGVQRHFRYDWQEVARYNPDYRRFVEAERERLGESHPLFKTQYALETIEGGRGFLSAAQRAWLQGTHLRRHAPDSDHGVYVAGIDLAGEAETLDTDAAIRLAQPRRDSTVVTIARVLPSALMGEGTGEGDPLARVLGPDIEVLDHVWYTGRNLASLVGDLAGLLGRTWRCRRVVVDATGIGAGIASMLVRLLGSRVVHPFTFTIPGKSRLGFDLIAAVNAGRLKLYRGDGSPEFQQFWREIDLAQVRYRAGRAMDFYVDPREGHDDFLVSLALAVEAASLYQPRVARGREAQSV